MNENRPDPPPALGPDDTAQTYGAALLCYTLRTGNLGGQTDQQLQWCELAAMRALTRHHLDVDGHAIRIGGAALEHLRTLRHTIAQVLQARRQEATQTAQQAPGESTLDKPSTGPMAPLVTPPWTQPPAGMARRAPELIAPTTAAPVLYDF